MSFRPEPDHTHGRAPTIGVLLVNLGTPDAPTPEATRRYLAQFLSDPRVIEIPKAAWWPILHGVILRTRLAKSAKKYASIWMKDGSPLMVWTTKQAKLLQGQARRVGPSRSRCCTRCATATPRSRRRLDALRADGATRVLVLPAYPQYSGATTASVIDDVARWSLAHRHVAGVPLRQPVPRRQALHRRARRACAPTGRPRAAASCW